MKKITIVTTIAAILAVAPLTVGCGGETADEFIPEEEEEEDEDEDGGGVLEPSDSENEDDE